MKFANATNLNRKSGGAKSRDLQFADLFWKREYEQNSHLQQ